MKLMKGLRKSLVGGASDPAAMGIKLDELEALGTEVDGSSGELRVSVTKRSSTTSIGSSKRSSTSSKRSSTKESKDPAAAGLDNLELDFTNLVSTGKDMDNLKTILKKNNKMKQRDLMRQSVSAGADNV